MWLAAQVLVSTSLFHFDLDKHCKHSNEQQNQFWKQRLFICTHFVPRAAFNFGQLQVELGLEPSAPLIYPMEPPRVLPPVIQQYVRHRQILTLLIQIEMMLEDIETLCKGPHEEGTFAQDLHNKIQDLEIRVESAANTNWLVLDQLIAVLAAPPNEVE